MPHIRAIYSDNEGCIIPGKGLPFPILELQKLRTQLQKHKTVGFGICTGRSIPYVEAMIQILDLVASPFPCICEGGAILYWPKDDHWEPLIPPPNKETILKVVEGMDFREEPGKIVCLSLYPNGRTTVDDLFDVLAQSNVSQQYNITTSMAAVDITPKGVDKLFGIKEAFTRLRISIEEVLTIGDAQNDIPLLQAAGYSACPINAVDEVKKIVDFVAASESTKGMQEILNHFEPDFY